jgi:hypothetical protein
VDRFHLVRNLAEVLEKLLANCRAEIRQQDADQLLPQKEGEEPARPLPTPTSWQQRTPPPIELAHQARQASRDDRFRQMSALRAHGLTQAAIAKRMGMSERAVRTWLKRGAAPTWKPQFRRRSVFDPYAAYVLERWQEGVHEAKQLYEEIRAQGFPGTVRIVQRGCSRPWPLNRRRSHCLRPPQPNAFRPTRRLGCSFVIRPTSRARSKPSSH